MNLKIRSEQKRTLLYLLIVVGIALMALTGCLFDDNDDPVENWPTPNPYLSSPLYGITHFDSSQSDSTPYGPPPGVFHVDPATQPICYGGPINIMTLASVNEDYMWSVGTDHVAYVYKKSGAWESVAKVDAPAYTDPENQPNSPETLRAFGELSAAGKTIAEMNEILTGYYGSKYASRVLNGMYSVVDRDDVLYANFGYGIYAFVLNDKENPSSGIKILRKIEDARTIQGDQSVEDIKMWGLTLTYDGYLIVNFTNGVAVIDRELNIDSADFYPFGTDEKVANSLAVDENNGIYIASDKIMRKLVWTGTVISDKESDGAWSSAYDAPEDAAAPVIKFGLGTGSTPTLMGFGDDPDKLVVITDGEKQMKLVAFWRDNIPEGFVQKSGTKSRRIADQIQVTCGITSSSDWIQSEQSVVVSGYGAFVVNNIPADVENSDLAMAGNNKLLTVSLMGPAYDTCFGMERFQWDSSADEWISVWSRPDVSSTSMVPIHSQNKGLAIVNGYTSQRGWEVTGLDWYTGRTVHQTIFGEQNFGNGAYAILEYLDNGDLLFNSISGPFRVHYGN